MVDACLMNPTEASTIVRNAEAELIKMDEELTLIAAREHQSLKHINCGYQILAACVGQCLDWIRAVLTQLPFKGRFGS